MNSTASTLSQKIQTLSDDQLAEVEDFVEFVRLRGRPHVAATLSGASFEAVWNNPEDAAYDAL